MSGAVSLNLEGLGFGGRPPPVSKGQLHGAVKKIGKRDFDFLSYQDVPRPIVLKTGLIGGPPTAAPEGVLRTS